MAESSSSQIIYNQGERCLCYHGPLIYEAKILKVQEVEEPHPTTGQTGRHYFVHYKGWKQTWDEWVPGERLLKFDETNIAKQKSLQDAAKAANAASSNKAHGKSKHNTAGATTGRDREPITAVGTRAGARKDGARGVKRAREDDDNIRRNEMKIVVPEVLKVILVDDWEAVTKNNQTVTLPRSPTVEQLLKQFEEHIKTAKPPNLREPEILARTIITGLQIYFDRSLGMNLLYRLERPQYAMIRKQYVTGQQVKIEENVEMSSLYGAEHLLRMLVAMPQMVANSSMDPESVGLVKDYVNELLKYMEAEKDRIFQREYETTSQAYQNTARS
ncbi:MRG-domain-containing protein [Dendrothele bispora CBS 962.96]|uniref:Chromatin modification-related protein EAF3 n=1 Tax=Dendrothele bispora (strain CBS 962.96) TaxID=1314807 RepID=A0A4S8M875_DENBC|nr:MRG-domain-containing protein [Dendrothele bispora CBS 962.96]